MIQLLGVHLQRGVKMLLDQADLTIHPGQKWGLIGANGSGKSTLFSMLLGKVHEDAGQCLVPKQWQISHMAQEVGTSRQTALDYVVDGDHELRLVQAAIDNADNHGEKLATLFGKMEAMDGYTAVARAQRLLHGLGFKTEDDQRPVNDFSGGWRIRLNLAKALMCRSDLLLLDEPTNHLDLDATVWLEQWLLNYKGTLLIISHDRDFLDNVINSIVSLDNQKLVAYSGNYSAYELQKAERLAQQSAAFAKQQERVAEIEDFVRRFRAKATKAKQAQSRLKELERMEKIAPAHIDSPFTFRFPEPDKIPNTLITLSEAAIGYKTDADSEKILANSIELSVLATTRIGLLGHNGAGKTTLIKTLSKNLPLLAGNLVEGLHLKIGYFAQHQLEALDLNSSCALHLQRLNAKATEQEIRNFLGGFGFQGDRAFENITHFSGGEKARLALAIVAWQKPNLLILDEPTNHLDLEMRHALTLALQGFSGALVVVSHDRHLLRNTVDDFYLVDGGKVQAFDGTLEDYQRWLANEDISSNQISNGPNVSSAPESSPGKTELGTKADKKEQRQIAAQQREKLKPLSNAVKKLEKEIEDLHCLLSSLETKLSDPELYQSGGKLLENLLLEQGQTRYMLEEKEELWMDKSEQLEALQNAAS
ncbi:MAG: ATP-binding cassette subfamily F protein 3 [Lentisphaeria bacterium]|jgi:ATP-binding cassette subfamily F protein 3